ncbi:MAG: 23S rRNA pseudouridine(2604) synthase RluF, partial [Lachnospiraceae bacterium]|nr:23S rRNA pseudouridine(2604) synthase RluF [Lachnospiraceae bacterium]
IRINKYLSDAGVCSRREADTYIAAGEVTIDGEKAVMGSKVLPGQKVVFRGKPLERVEEQVLIAFNKPVGIVCTTDSGEPDNIVDFINYPSRIYPIGRLDKDSEGLILLTNDGDIVNKILRAGNNHEKEYQVVVNKPLTKEFIEGMQKGVPILDTVTKPCKILVSGTSSFNIIITQGLNRQIRRMCEYFDYRVLSLRRIRIMHISLGKLNVGTYRNLTKPELDKLREELALSSKLSMKETKAEAAREAKLLKEYKHKEDKEKNAAKVHSNYGNKYSDKAKNSGKSVKGNYGRKQDSKNYRTGRTTK